MFSPFHLSMTGIVNVITPGQRHCLLRICCLTC